MIAFLCVHVCVFAMHLKLSVSVGKTMQSGFKKDELEWKNGKMHPILVVAEFKIHTHTHKFPSLLNAGSFTAVVR